MQSAQYVEAVMKAAGYEVTKNAFDFVYVETVAETLKVGGASPREVPIKLMTYTASGPADGVTARLAVVPVDADGTNGCEPGDFAPGAFTGRIALVKRGGCTFAVKQANAAAAGAVGAVIYNNTEGALSGTLGEADAGKVPTGGISQAEGEKLAAEAAAGPVEVTLDIRELRENRTTYNVIAETRGGDENNTVFLGAHLDSVAASTPASTTTAPARPASSRSRSASRAARRRSRTRSSSPGGRRRSSACSAPRRTWAA